MEEKKEGWLKTRMIVELAGAPREHIAQALVIVGEKFGQGIREIKVKKISVREPQKMEGKEIWTGFLEIYAEIKNIETLIGIIFDYLPSSVEIEEPQELMFPVAHINGVLNDLAGRLHQYDATVKLLKTKLIIEKKAKAGQDNLPQKEKKDEAKSQ